MSTAIYIYNVQTGVFTGQSYHLNIYPNQHDQMEGFVEANAPAGHAGYVGQVDDHLSQRIDPAIHAKLRLLRNELQQHLEQTKPVPWTGDLKDMPADMPALTPVSQDVLDWRQQQQAQIDALKTKLIIDYQPPAPSPDHEWNAETKRWQVKPDVVEAQQRRASAQAQINALELRQLRPLRELAVDPADGDAKARVVAIDEEIAGLRAQLI